MSTPIVTVARVAAACAIVSPNTSVFSFRLYPGGDRSGTRLRPCRRGRRRARRRRARGRVFGERRGVHEHPGRDQEERDQEGAADELDSFHEQAAGRDEAIEPETREEGPDDSLEPTCPPAPPPTESREQDEGREPRCRASRIPIARRAADDERVGSEADHAECELARPAALCPRRSWSSRPRCEHEQRGRVGDDRSARGHPPPQGARDPRSWTIGYETSVCDAHSDPKRIAVRTGVAERRTIRADTNGNVKVNAPNIGPVGGAVEPSRSNSSPARNMR